MHGERGVQAESAESTHLGVCLVALLLRHVVQPDTLEHELRLSVTSSLLRQISQSLSQEEGGEDMSRDPGHLGLELRGRLGNER